ncbi:hypothetical protein PRK78_002603 [Emydomyces testavorans]|uniref:Aminoglycoside phosphotransferase domain-containing protein n=1 Tax=Emydomyces testavorans TaxID=2070801 RepID=A0AAF0DGP3_9EURO|nr:hypothetical protein PRK78_002603 [Emydomyces testavorans]
MAPGTQNKSSQLYLMWLPYITQIVDNHVVRLAWNNNDDFFRYTRSRFLCDEDKNLSQRYVRFNVEELAKIAAEVVGPGTRCCVKVEKLADGMYNKALLLTMDDGIQVVGKVPNPNAGLPHLTTASEVATTDFVKNVLGTPAPKILGWNSKSDNPVGAEYVIMEKVKGVPLEKLWNRLDSEVKSNLVEQIAAFQRCWTLTTFVQYGGLYYKGDLPNSMSSLVYTNHKGKRITDDRFAVGPSVSRNNVHDERNQVESDRGPWNSAIDYAMAAGHREIACISQASQLPKSPIAIYGPGYYVQSKERKIKALQAYLKLVEHILPDDEDLKASHLWHSDMHRENVFVDPENPTKICGIIDWQSTELGPLYDHVIQPYILDYDGPPLDGDLLQRPELKRIENMVGDDLAPPEKKQKVDTLLAAISLVSQYRHLIHLENKPLFHALEFQQTMKYRMLKFAQAIFVEGEATYLSIVADQYRKGWEGFPRLQDDPDLKRVFPFTFSKKELEIIDFDSECVSYGIGLMQDVREAVGLQFFRVDGTVDHDMYNAAKGGIRMVKKDFMSKYPRNEDERKAWEMAWPFDD